MDFIDFFSNLLNLNDINFSIKKKFEKMLDKNEYLGIRILSFITILLFFSAILFFIYVIYIILF